MKVKNEIIVKTEHAEVLITLRHSGRSCRALISKEDIDLVKGHRWGISGRYAQAWFGEMGELLLHRFILGVRDSKVHVDHINQNGLDNRRTNLRVATHAQNLCNQSPKDRGFKGVYRPSKGCKWQVQIQKNNRTLHIGYFENEVEAAIAYDRAAVELHGKFACLNFPFLW